MSATAADERRPITIIGIVLIARGALFIAAGWQLRKLESDLAH
jgi:hypothetical protein